VLTYLDVGASSDGLLRGAVHYTLEWPKDLETALRLASRAKQSQRMRLAGYKFLLDGQTKMAYCHEPHNGVRWDTPTWNPAVFKDAVRQLHDTGLQLSVHCVGDAAVDLTLDAFEEAMNASPRPDPRHRIEHCVICTPQATRRMRDLGVVVCTQPQFLRLGAKVWEAILGPERARRAMVTREWLDNGVHVALSSDAPTTPWLTPQVTLFGAVSRITVSNKRHMPEQALTIGEAMRAHTMGAAYAQHDEQIKGSIEAGKLADLVVWPQDPLTMPMNQLWRSPIDMTIIGGEVAYSA